MVFERWTDEMIDGLAFSVGELRESVSELRESVSEVRDSVGELRESIVKFAIVSANCGRV